MNLNLAKSLSQKNCSFTIEYYAISTTIFVLIPVYRFIVYPLIHKYVPSLLKMIGAGLFLSLVSTVIHTVVTAVEYFSEQPQNITMPDTPQVSLYWILVVEYLNGIGAVVTFVFAIEFAMAQTPNRMRGIIMGLMLTMVGWTRHGGDFITKIFHVFKVSQRYTFYCYLVLPPLAMLMLIIFVIAAKRYKLRERERHVNIQAIVEEHYERYFDQEEEYTREITEMLADNS